jgi:dihydrodipicolinate synthase/N-acetylneuraminate lyase
MLLFLLVLAGFAFYIMSPEERKRVLQWMLAASVVIRRIAVLVFAGLRMFVQAIQAKNRVAQATAIALMFAATVGAIQLLREPPTDMRPEIERLLAVESETTAIYDAAATQFKQGALDSESLARLIERKIKPQLQGVRVRVMALENVRDDHQPLLEKAK